MKAVITVNSRIYREISIDRPGNESMLADILYGVTGDLSCPVTDIPWYMEGSAWAFNFRSPGDSFSADGPEGILFEITIEE